MEPFREFANLSEQRPMRTFLPEESAFLRRASWPEWSASKVPATTTLENTNLIKSAVVKSFVAEESRKRIMSDITQFDESAREAGKRKRKLTAELLENLQRAKNYRNDAEYFLKKGDLFTAWGAINYAHGILDAVRKQIGLECYGALE